MLWQHDGLDFGDCHSELLLMFPAHMNIQLLCLYLSTETLHQDLGNYYFKK